MNSPSVRRTVLAGFLGLAVAMGVGRFAFTPLLPLMQEDMRLTLAAGGWLASANYVGYLVGAVMALSMRVDARVTIRTALLVTALVTAAMGLTESFAAWVALRAIAGVASAFVLIHVSAWALRRMGSAPQARAGVFSGVGCGIFAVASACLLLDLIGWQAGTVWIVVGGLSLLATLGIWSLFDSPVATPAAPPLAVADAPQRRGRLTLAYAAVGFGYIIPATFLAAMARTSSAGSSSVDLAWPAFGLAACASTFVAARLGNSAVQIWRWSQAIMAVGVAVLALSSALPALIVAGICIGGTFVVITMAAMEVAKEVGGREPRQLMALLTIAFAAGQIAGPVAVSLFAGTDGDLTALLWAAVVLLAVGFFALGNSPRSQTHAAVSE